jgi:hypothetical protein
MLSEPPLLSSSITDSTNITCFGLSDGTATVTPSGGTPPYAYLWDDDASTIDSTVTGLTAGGYYHVIITDAMQCLVRDSITLVEPSRINLGTIIGDDEVEQFLSCSYSVDNKENHSFNWIAIGGNVISGQGTNVVEIQWANNNNGQIKLVAESELGCLSDTARKEISIINTGIEIQQGKTIKIYPNPSEGMIWIKTYGIGAYTVEISSLNGQVLIYHNETDSINQLNIANIEKGTYIITIRSQDLVIIRKLIRL